MILLLLQSLLPTVLISAFLCYIFAPLITYFDRLKISRAISVSLLVILFLTFLMVGAYRLVPVLYDQAVELLNLVPKAQSTISDHWIPRVRELLLRHRVIDIALVDKSIGELSLMNEMVSQVQQGLNALWQSAPKVVGTLVNVILVPLLTFFMLKDLKPAQRRLRQLVPHDLLPATMRMLARIDLTLRSVIKGQVTVAAVLAILYILGFQLVGLTSGFAIGLIAGMCRVVPYLDVIVGGALSLIVLISHFAGWGQILAVLGVFMLVQSLDGMLITPRIIGVRVGLHPAVVILSVFVFSDLFGFSGVLLAVPIAALVKSLGEVAISYYLRSAAYEGVAQRRTVQNTIGVELDRRTSKGD